MEEIHVMVRGVRKNEYMQSIRQMALRSYLWMCVVVAGVVVFFTVLTGDTRPQSFLVPLALLVIVPVVYELYQRKSYQTQPFDTTEMEYWLSSRGWRMEAFGNRAVFTWANTRLVETRDDLLLYTARQVSSLLPKRCLTAEELAQIRAWAKNK